MRRKPWKVVKEGSVVVTIYEEPTGYRAVWYAAGERQRKFHNRADDAVEFAKMTAAALASGEVTEGRAAAEDLKYLAELRAKLGTTPVHTAVDYYLAHRRVEELIDATIKDLFTEFGRHLEDARRSPSYRDAISKYVGPFVRDYPGKIGSVTADRIDHWMKCRSESPHSRRHFLESLITFFRWARDVKKALPMGLKTEPELVRKPEPRPNRIEIYTPEEMRLFLKFATPTEKAILILGGFVGLRSSEITGEKTEHEPLGCEDVIFAEKAVRVTQKMQHESRERFVDLQPNAIALLKPLLKGKSGPIIITAKGGRARAAKVLAGLVVRIRAAGHALRLKRNGLRRSYITYRTAVVGDPAKVADECNTSPQEIRIHYRRPGFKRVAHEWFSIGMRGPRATAHATR